GQNRILVVKGANDALLPADVDAAEDLLRTADCIVMQLEIPLETVYHTLRVGRRLGVRTILNPAPGQKLDLQQLANADYVIPNETEAEALSGLPVTNLHEARACAVHLLRGGLRRIIVTLGANGALLASEETVEHIAPHLVEAVDTTGAGDAFIGSFARFLAGGVSEREAIRRANVYAAMSTLGIGTQSSFVSAEQFESVWAAK
ncbi:MAG TPA: ribokinase, partial [Candidatus Sulfopaludibacter sp.]|nr:ribokinase [Candidatus Sulfopaludibacter sp.]